MFMAKSFLSKSFSCLSDCSISATKITASSKLFIEYGVTRARKMARPSRDGNLPTSTETRP